MAKPFKLLDASQGRPCLDRYELIAELAAGGMAVVYLARIVGAGGFQRFVAIKRLHPHLAHEAGFVEMFLDEARLAASIHHPNVVPILEVGESASGYYLVMEYIEGDTLWNLYNIASSTKPGGRLPPMGAVRVVHDALLGLHAAHELRDERGQLLEVVHRDVSPQNILVGVDGTARLTDFGVAKAATRLSSTRSGELKGKMAYMAPEQLRGDGLDRRSDLFAMGIVLWEVLAGRHLFLGPNEAATMHRALNEPVPDLYTLAPGIPKKLAEVVARSLQRDPAKRFSSALEMAEAIEHCCRSTTPLPQPREIAALVDSLVGQRIFERKEAIQQWLAHADSTSPGARVPLAQPPGLRPSPPTSTPYASGTSLSPLLSGASPSPSPSRKAFWIAPAAVGLLIGGAWVASRQKTATEAAPQPTASLSAPSAPASSAPPAASAAPAPPATTSAAPSPAATDKPKKPTKPATKPQPLTAPQPDNGGLDKSPYR